MGKNVWDSLGKRIGSTTKLPGGKVAVYDHNSQPIGTATPNGTFTVNSKLISRTPLVGLLFNRTPKQRK